MESMQPDLLQALMKKQLQGTISADELAQLQSYVGDEGNKEAVTAALAGLLCDQEPDAVYDPMRFDPVLQSVLQADKPEGILVPLRRRRYGWLAAAAILIAIAGVGLFYLYRADKSATDQPIVSTPAHDALPGQEGAVLTLANGNHIVLDTAKTGVVEEQGIRAVIRNGMLVYEVPAGTTEPVAYNTMSTPRGRQFQLVLADGTRVWLNAASSITYPTRFEEGIRRVSVTGEVYFEVAPLTPKGGQRKIPFIVNIAPFEEGQGGTTVEVLGTHFNISAYGDDGGVATTLLEGAVKVTRGTDQGILHPGEQMVIRQGRLKRNSKVDVAAVMAWKEGMFNFNKTPFPVVMGQLERWYDVDVVYEGAVPAGSLSGEIPRTLLLSEVLRILELSGLHYTIRNKKLMISDK